ncbi:phosphotransferase family protein [Colletotrichum truncatum]|uniref:Phosphotransferase family protein n=1 Tax=Colletotrichum truncatum TaxID=5467 RepID=A0ACC3YL05_COLTU|nr:phosphotransferase family protein [Colletotrichum truncatum]KAF6782585.1 phosphotransferase family protein [Colletotrichum truncatum]
MAARQDSDNLAWDRSDDLWEEAVRQVRLSSQCQKIESFAKSILGEPAKFTTPLVIGGFNVLYPIRLEGISPSVLVRLPCPNQAIFPEEKTISEAATARYIAKHTQLLVPKVFHYGNYPGIGPFMIIQDLGSRKTMSQALDTSPNDPDETAVLNPDISDSRLTDLYMKMARCVLQLAQPTFPRIGALVEIRPESQCVTGRPLTLNMNNMARLSNIPKSVFPSEGTTYQTADEWYVVLAEMQIATLLFQHNDIISSEDDCRNKYVARQLFRRLAKQGQLSKFGFAEDDWSARSKHAGTALPMPHSSSSFRLWCDDFRPGNVLVDENDNVLGAVDWEFAYAGPAQFLLDSPWWLLLDVPEMWVDGIEDWACVYERRLRIWLMALGEAEKEMSSESLLLSAYMRESWETGRFWLNYAARKSWAFDTIYWKYLDKLFFGERGENIPIDELWKTRVHLLSQEEQAAMEMVVQIKMEESKERVLIEWDAIEARQRLSSILFD